jgi:hypothetical protein
MRPDVLLARAMQQSPRRRTYVGGDARPPGSDPGANFHVAARGRSALLRGCVRRLPSAVARPARIALGEAASTFCAQPAP